MRGDVGFDGNGDGKFWRNIGFVLNDGVISPIGSGTGGVICELASDEISSFGADGYESIRFSSERKGFLFVVSLSFGVLAHCFSRPSDSASRSNRSSSRLPPV